MSSTHWISDVMGFWRHTGAGRSRTGEHHHETDAFLVARRVVAEHEYGPRRTTPVDAYARPYIDCARQPVTARRHEHDALSEAACGFVDSFLNSGAVFGRAVAMDVEGWSFQVNRHGIIEPGGQCRCRGEDDIADVQCKDKQETLPNWSIHS